MPDSLESLTYVEGTPPRKRDRGLARQGGAAEEAGMGIGDKLKIASVERARPTGSSA